MFSLSVKQSFCIFLSWIWVGLDWGRLILPCSSPGKQLASLSLLWYLRKMRNPSMAHQLICCLGPDWPERILKLAVQWKLLKGFESHTLKMIMKLENERKRLSRKDVQEAKRFPNCKDNQTPALASNWCCFSSVEQPFIAYSGAMHPLKKNQHLNVESCIY